MQGRSLGFPDFGILVRAGLGHRQTWSRLFRHACPTPRGRREKGEKLLTGLLPQNRLSALSDASRVIVSDVEGFGCGAKAKLWCCSSRRRSLSCCFVARQNFCVNRGIRSAQRSLSSWKRSTPLRHDLLILIRHILSIEEICLSTGERFVGVALERFLDPVEDLI